MLNQTILEVFTSILQNLLKLVPLFLHLDKVKVARVKNSIERGPD